jgi:hypothetical protein
MANIYLSSTYSDMKEYRDAVLRVLRMLRHDVRAMEDYAATDRRPLDECLRDVKSADVYVGLLGWRYGFIPDQDNPEQKSITEREYRQAEDCGIPRLMFLLEEGAPWPDEYKDSVTGDGDNGRLISEFRNEIGNVRTVRFFRAPDQLAGLVSASVTLCLQEKRAARPAGPRVKDVRRKAYELRLNALLEDYEAATKQLAYTLDAVDQQRIKRRIADLEQEIGQVEDEYKDVDR